MKTKRVKLGTAVLILPYRHPIYTAKVLSTVDILSGGCLVVGVGAGWLKQEFTALGQSITERGGRTNEAIDIFKTLWAEAGGITAQHAAAGGSKSGSGDQGHSALRRVGYPARVSFLSRLDGGVFSTHGIDGAVCAGNGIESMKHEA